MNILALGAAGFVGLAALQKLKNAGYCIRIADTAERLHKVASSIANYEQVTVDWPNTDNLGEALYDIDTVLHFAWTTNPASSMQNIESDATQNIVSSIKLAEACVSRRVTRLIFMSSGGTVYGNVAESLIDESHSTDPLCAYGVSKLAVEKYLQIYNEKYNLETLSLRISNPYGIHQLMGSKVGVIANFLRNLHSQNPVTLFGDGGTVRDYLHIDDLSNAILAAVEIQNPYAKTFNVSYGTGYSLQNIVEIIQSVTGKEVLINKQPERRFDVRHIVLSNSRFRNATEWRPQIEIAEGIELMWKHLQSGSISVNDQVA